MSNLSAFMKPEALERQAREGAAILMPVCGQRCALTVEPVSGPVGGGSLPGVSLPGWAVCLRPHTVSVEELEEFFRRWETPIVGRIHRGALLLDARTVRSQDWAVIAAALEACLSEARPG